MSQEEVEKQYQAFYKDEYFVRMQRPSLSNVRGSNFCDIAFETQEDRVVCVSAIDNLVKGAAGQAIQNMNIICGYNEETGLIQAGMNPWYLNVFEATQSEKPREFIQGEVQYIGKFTEVVQLYKTK